MFYPVSLEYSMLLMLTDSI